MHRRVPLRRGHDLCKITANVLKIILNSSNFLKFFNSVELRLNPQGGKSNNFFWYFLD